MPDSLYPRLSQIGLTLTEQERTDIGTVAAYLRRVNTQFHDDDLGELADQLDAIAMPIVVQP